MTTNQSAEPALSAAQNWLALLDKGDFAESWKQAASLFKSAVTMKQWQDTLAAVRVPLGKPISRTLKSKQYTEELPGVPDGKYYVVEYNSSFDKKKHAIETVVPMMDKDRWRVSGYFIK